MTVDPEAAARQAFIEFTSPVRCQASTRELALFASAEQRWLEVSGPRQDVDGSRVPLYSFGSGPTVIALHGWGGRAAQFAAFVEPLVSRGLSVLSFDASAHGEAPGRRTSLFEFVSILESVAADCEELAGVVGHSLGGSSAMLAMAAGLRVPRAVLIAPTPGLREEVSKFAARTGLPGAIEDGLVAQMGSHFTERVWEETRLTHLASRVSSEVLVIQDEHDPDVPHHESVKLVNALRQGELHSTSGLGHLAILRRNEVARRAADFIISRTI